MGPLKQEIELEKVLNTVKCIEPNIKLPPIHMFQFIDRDDRYGDASSIGEIRLSMRTIGDFDCKNEQFVSTIIHEVTHLNCWEEGHNEKFQMMNAFLFDRVWKKLMEGGSESGT